MFECIVQHDGVELARGSGKSKKAAESEAALAALKKLRETEGASAKSEAPKNPKPVLNPKPELVLPPIWKSEGDSFARTF